MKKLKLFNITILLICSVISANCQTSNDSCTCIPNKKLRAAAVLIEQGKRDASLLQIANRSLELTNSRISIKDSIISQYVQKVSAKDSVINTFIKEVRNVEDQKNIALATAVKLDKKYRRQKMKTIFGIIGSSAVTTAIFIILKK